MADEIDSKLAEVRGKLDEIHQWLAGRVRQAEADSAATKAEHATLQTEHAALKAKYDALVAKVREALGVETPSVPSAPLS